MQQTLSKILTLTERTLLLSAVLLAAPLFAFAEGVGVPNPEIEPVTLNNPLNASISTIPDLLFAILHIVMILMIPIIVFFIIYSGFKYVTARGNAAQVEEASQSLLYAIIGGLLILGAIAISDIIKNIVDAFAAP